MYKNPPHLPDESDIAIAPAITTSILCSTDSAAMHPSHTLPTELRAIANAGFTQAELGFPDLEEYAEKEYEEYSKLDRSGQGDVDKLVQAAEKIKTLRRTAPLSDTCCPSVSHLVLTVRYFH